MKDDNSSEDSVAVPEDQEEVDLPHQEEPAEVNVEVQAVAEVVEEIPERREQDDNMIDQARALGVENDQELVNDEIARAEFELQIEAVAEMG